MEIDQNYLQTGTAIGSRASPEHLLRFLVENCRFEIVHNSFECVCRMFQSAQECGLVIWSG